MNFPEALKVLEIEDYAERIWNSNSHGELFHTLDYIHYAEVVENNVELKGVFNELFGHAVDYAEKNWQHPEHVFQHMPKMFSSMLGQSSA